MTVDVEQRADTPPRERIMRVTPFVRAGAEGSDGLTLDGYAAVFRQETLIDSWEGRFFEQLAPGSTKKTLSEQTPRLQFDHGTHPMIGSIPIGKIQSVKEERNASLAPDGGVHVVARVFDNWLTAPVRDAIAEEAVNGMSFRFSVVKEEWRTAGGDVIKDPQELQQALFRSWVEDVPPEELLHRTLREVRISELGPVVWPAYDGTSVGMRSVTIDLAAVRSGDAAERRKLAQALFVADSPEADEDVVPDVDDGASLEETRDNEPGGTSEADAHSEPPSDEPEATVGAGDHSTYMTAQERRELILRNVRSICASLPNQ